MMSSWVCVLRGWWYGKGGLRRIPSEMAVGRARAKRAPAVALVPPFDTHDLDPDDDDPPATHIPPPNDPSPSPPLDGPPARGARGPAERPRPLRLVVVVVQLVCRPARGRRRRRRRPPPDPPDVGLVVRARLALLVAAAQRPARGDPQADRAARGHVAPVPRPRRRGPDPVGAQGVLPGAAGPSGLALPPGSHPPFPPAARRADLPRPRASRT